jgi:hypothetical protein
MELTKLPQTPKTTFTVICLFGSKNLRNANNKGIQTVFFITELSTMVDSIISHLQQPCLLYSEHCGDKKYSL